MRWTTPGPADAHDAGVLGCHWLLMLLCWGLGVPLAKPKPGPADAHDARVLGSHWLSQVQLMFMMLGSWDASA